MKKFLLLTFLSTLFLASYAEDVNIAPEATPSASYTSSWGTLSSINNGKHFTGYPDNSETWVCYHNSGGGANVELQWLQYDWTEEQTIGCVAVYFSWNTNGGNGVDVPSKWVVQYKEGGEWHDVTLLANEEYTSVKDVVNSVKFKSVTTTSLRLMLYAIYSTSQNMYCATGVNEWEVYGEGEAADKSNVALAATVNGDEAYTPTWNSINSINDGYSFLREDDTDGKHTWGCWTKSHNLETQTLRYIWSETYSIDNVAVYFTSHSMDLDDGGVAMPAEWSLQYYNLSTSTWEPVTLFEGEEYTLNREAANTVKFEPIVTNSMKLVLKARLATGKTFYNAMGVNEWEVYGSKTTFIPEEITATMKVSGTAHWGTFVAPFRIAVSDLPAGIEAYNVTYDGTKIVNTKIADDTDIPANLPVLLCNTTDKDITKSLTKDTNTELFPHDNNLVGTTTALANVPLSVERDAQTYNTYLLQYKSGVIGWYKVAQDGLSLIANRAYLVVPATGVEAKDFIAIEDMPTGIEAAPGQVQEFKGSRDQVYNLAGQRIANGQQSTANSLPKGVYIINGRKEIRK